MQYKYKYIINIKHKYDAYNKSKASYNANIKHNKNFDFCNFSATMITNSR